MAKNTPVTENETSNQEGTHGNNIYAYSDDVPEDITSARKILEGYSGIPPGQVIPHIYAVREKAHKVHPYSCLGRFRFLDLSISLHPLYPLVLSRLKDSYQTLLDLGCCFGQDIRSLVADGAPSENLYGADIHPEFLELGYELFRDKESLGAHFLVGDVFDDEGEGGKELKKLDGKIDIIHAASFMHLFAWAQQVQLGIRMVQLLRPTTKDALVLGRQRGATKPGVYPTSNKSLMTYVHDPASFQRLWDEVGEKTGTKWNVIADLRIVRGWGKEEQEGQDAGGGTPRMMRFEVHRVE